MEKGLNVYKTKGKKGPSVGTLFNIVIKSVQADESLTKTCLTWPKKLQIMCILYHLAALTEALLTRVVPHREIQEANTNPMVVLWTTGNVISVVHNKKLLSGESATLWAKYDCKFCY